jgi:hypothetical protein
MCAKNLMDCGKVLQIRMIRTFFGLPDPHPDPLVTRTDPAPTLDPSITKQKIVRKTLASTVLSDFFDFLSLS